MSIFGLACEGITDQITIENILCGYFDDDELEEEITYLQPLNDATRAAQQGFGGWLELLKYLTTERFRDDVLNVKHLIIQVDTDVSNDKHFDVSHYDENNQELSIEALINKVVARMIEQIDQGDSEFYAQHKDKIIFCISVHSIECWLLALHTPKPPKNPKTKNCEKALQFTLSKDKRFKPHKFGKNKRFYDLLSEPFLTTKTLKKTAEIEPSLQVFVRNLEHISL